MSLAPPEKVGKLQEALHAQAKGSPTYRFDALYDKVHRTDVLWHAYHICQSNGGVAGVDGQTFEDIENYGRGWWLDELAKGSRWCLLDVSDRVRRLNQMMVGWANYFCRGPVTKAYRRVNAHARERFRQWLCRKHEVRDRGHSRFPDDYLHKDLGLATLRLGDRNVSWAKA